MDTQVFCYDDLSRLTWAGSSGTPVCSGAPTPSDTGSLVGTGGAQYSASYTYDTLNRLTSSSLGGYTYGDAAHVDAATTIGVTWSASYDAAGNLTCRAATSATTCSGASPSGAALSYDNEGQLATWANAQSSPTASASYLYDGEGQRVEQVATTNGTTTTTSYIGALEEIATTGTTTTTTAYYGGLALSVNGALSYTLSDGLGSVSEAVNATTGAVTATQLYAPYGAVRYASGTLPGSRAFTGQRSDASTSGLDYYGARYYDPAAGQFTSADSVLPKRGATPDPSQLNRFAYVAGNPESRADPTGHDYTGPAGGGVPVLDPVPNRTNYYNDYMNNYWADINAGKGKYYPGLDPKESYKDPDGEVLAKYFGLSVYGVDAPGKVSSADFYVAINRGLAFTPLGDFGVEDPAPPAYRTDIELYTPDAGTPWLATSDEGKRYGVIPKAYSKGKQASIMAIDITKLYPDGRPSNEELNGYAAQIVYWTPGKTYATASSRVARVLFLYDGKVIDDYAPAIFGGHVFGPPGPEGRPPEVAGQPVDFPPLL